MLYKALISFTGKKAMTIGEVGEISDTAVVKDLLKAGYIEEVAEKKKTAPKKK